MRLVIAAVINFVVIYGFFSWRRYRKLGFYAVFISSIVTFYFALPLYTQPIAGQISMSLVAGALGVQAYFVLYARFK